ncbi:hypothetical protein AgCh_010592 [Apium graveolens]
MSDPVEDLNLVSNLIDHDDKEWRQELIIEHFCENDVKRILAVPSSWRNQNDDLTWAFTNDGIYSVKTAYMLGQGINLEVVHEAWDFTGSVIFAATKRIRAYWSPEVAEAKAIDIAVRLGRKYGLEEVILESDCKNLVNRPSKGVTYLSDLDYVLDDILVTSTSFKSISWSHVKRDANSVAHHLGRSLVAPGVPPLAYVPEHEQQFISSRVSWTRETYLWTMAFLPDIWRTGAHFAAILFPHQVGNDCA